VYFTIQILFVISKLIRLYDGLKPQKRNEEED